MKLKLDFVVGKTENCFDTTKTYYCFAHDSVVSGRNWCVEYRKLSLLINDVINSGVSKIS